MDALDYWTTANALNVYQLSLLTEKYNPADFDDQFASNWPDAALRRTKPHIVAIQNAIISETLKPCALYFYQQGGVNWSTTLISVNDYRVWLASRGIANPVFHGKAPPDSDFTNPFGPFYAPKLAAAVDAWRAVTADPKQWRGKSPKKALEAWLRENAATYGLVNKDGSPNATGIAEVAKVANWKPAGGAPATPAPQTLSQVRPEPSPGFGKTPPQVPANPTYSSRLADLDDDIPF